MSIQFLIITLADDILEGTEEILISISSTDPALTSDGPLRITIRDANSKFDLLILCYSYNILMHFDALKIVIDY